MKLSEILLKDIQECKQIIINKEEMVKEKDYKYKIKIKRFKV